jgi:hypothetical protein
MDLTMSDKEDSPKRSEEIKSDDEANNNGNTSGLENENENENEIDEMDTDSHHHRRNSSKSDSEDKSDSEKRVDTKPHYKACCRDCLKENRANRRACICQVPSSQRRDNLGKFSAGLSYDRSPLPQVRMDALLVTAMAATLKTKLQEAATIMRKKLGGMRRSLRVFC